MSLDVVIAGELYIDLIMSGFEELPQSGQESFARNFHREPGGAAITAMGLAKLGTRTGVLGAVGAEDGGWLVERMRQAGVDTCGVRFIDGEFTGTTVVVSDPSDRMFLTYAGANRLVGSVAAESSIQARHLHWAAPADTGLLAQFRARGLTISLDVGFAHAGAHSMAALPHVDLFLPNEVEAARLTVESEPEAMLNALARAGARIVAIKLGARGAIVLAGGRLLRADSPLVTPVETTGAGDCFDAGFLHAWLRGDRLEACLALGNICGALSTRAPGGVAAFPSVAEIARLLE